MHARVRTAPVSRKLVSTDLALRRTVTSRRPRRTTFAWVRSHVLARLAAVFLLSLILVPFTAPFRTFDLHDTPGQHSSDGLPKDKVDADAAVVGMVAVLPTRWSDARDVRPAGIRAGDLAPSVVRPLVLRI